MSYPNYKASEKYNINQKVVCYGTICQVKKDGGCENCFMSYKPIDKRRGVVKKCNKHCNGVNMSFVSLPQEKRDYYKQQIFITKAKGN